MVDGGVKSFSIFCGELMRPNVGAGCGDEAGCFGVVRDGAVQQIV